MTTDQIHKATAFLGGIAAGDPERAMRCVDRGHYVEHDPRIADGAIGLAQFVGDRPKTYDVVDPIRVLEDGPFVVVQHRGDAADRLTIFELFRFSGSLIVEHWRFTAAEGSPNRSGHTQVDGPTQPRHLTETAANTQTVRDYYETVHLAGRHEEARRWFEGDLMIRHEPGVADGVEEFLHDLAILTSDRTIDAIRIVVGQGDMVFLVAQGTQGTHRDAPCAYIDLYRVEAGKLVEHWGFPEPFPPAAETRNNNGLI